MMEPRAGMEAGALTVRSSLRQRIYQNSDALVLLLGSYLWYRIGARLSLDAKSLRIGG